jgi:hypothetical protein
MAEYNATVRIYDPHAEAEATIKDLQRSGFGLNNISIVGRDYHTKGSAIGDDNVGNRMKVWCQLGEFWGGLSGLLMGSAFYFIPGIGPVIVFGPLVSWIVRALDGAVMTGELSALGAGLHSIGIPNNSIMAYERALTSDMFIIIAHGTLDTAKAKSILESPRAVQIAPRIRGALRRTSRTVARCYRKVRN